MGVRPKSTRVLIGSGDGGTRGGSASLTVLFALLRPCSGLYATYTSTASEALVLPTLLTFTVNANGAASNDDVTEAETACVKVVYEMPSPNAKVGLSALSL